MIFISYRVDDSNEAVEHLDTRLAGEFGRKAVFRDKKRLAGGDQWPDVLEEQAKSCRVMLVVIGAKWQTAAYTDDARLGQLRLHDPDDWVRKEITLALDHGATVIPVLLNGPKTPHRAWLTGCGLGRLADCQGMKLRTDEYDSDFSALVEAVRTHLPPPPAQSPPTPLTPFPPPPPRVWRSVVHHALQPAPHFAGRSELLKELSEWAVCLNDPVRVRALVAAGGTGKTAVAERVLASLPDENPFGVFVWSFYENPQTEAFLRAACEYFLGEAPKETGGLLEHLHRGLRAADLPHLLILDGLELVQAIGTTGRPRGELQDPLMKRFLRWLAAGRGTRAKALITSRFPLPDLTDWCESGFRQVELDDLDATAARAVFRKRGVKGSDAELNALTESVHGHALTVDVLGLYLQRFGNGDPKNANKFDLKSFAHQQKAERLSQVLTSYAAKLPNAERDLLARLSLFPRGVTVPHLVFIIRAGRKVAGALIGCNQARLLTLLEELRALGLVFESDSQDKRRYSAHPFLRDFFRGLLEATEPEQVHEAVREQIATGVDERPGTMPTDPAVLDSYEQLIEISRLAGKPETAFKLYRHGLGAYEHLGSGALGDFARGLRIASGFSADGTPEAVPAELDDRSRADLVNCWGLFARELGELASSERAFRHVIDLLDAAGGEGSNLSIGFRNLASIEFRAGRWPTAVSLANQALTHATESQNGTLLIASHAELAAGYAGLGKIAKARAHFALAATGSWPDKPYSFHALREVDFKLMVGDRLGALSQAQERKESNRSSSQALAVALLETAMGRCVLPGGSRQARTHYTAACAYASKTGNIEVTLRCYHLAAEIARRECDFQLAESEALDGIQFADSCGFGRWSLDIRTELAKIHLAADEPAKAIEPAQWVLKRSEEPDCQYAWGVADSLHLLGVAHARLGDKAKARDHLSRAVEKRRPLEHPGLGESEAELARLG